MKRRLGRIWADIMNKLPRKLRGKKSSVSTICVSEAKSDNKPVKEQNEHVNKGYTDNEVHPFQIAN